MAIFVTLAYISYELSQALGGMGIVAVRCCAFTMGHYGYRNLSCGPSDPRNPLTSNAVHVC